MNNIRRGHTFRIAFGIAVLIIITLMQAAQADDWIMYRHDPIHTGVSADIVAPPLNLLWKSEIGGFYGSSPSVSDGVVYVGSDDCNVYALDAGTGLLKWNYTTGCGSGYNIHSSPAVSGGVVYVGSTDHNVYALDAATGALKWKYTTGDAVISSPSISDGVVYVGSNDCNVYALDAGTGLLKWKYTTGCGIGYGVISSPSVSGGVVYVGSIDRDVYALDAGTGALKWSFTTGQPVWSSPAVSGGVVYVGSDDGNVYALDTGTGLLKWKYLITNTVFSSPAVSDGVVYVSQNGYVYAFAPAKGSIAGMKFNDLNGNGILDPGEPGLANWTITLTNDTGVMITQTTALDGSYNFTNLTDGNYTVGEVIQPGWIQTAPAVSATGSATYQVQISGGNAVEGKDFGNLHKGKITGGGWINITGGPKATFGIVGQYPDSSNTAQGDVEYQDHIANLNIKSIQINTVATTLDKKKGAITGLAQVNGAGSYPFEVYIEDNGEPGKGTDVFKISLPTYPYQNGAILSSGNIQIHS